MPSFKKPKGFKMNGTTFYGKSPFKGKFWDKVKTTVRDNAITRGIAKTGARGVRLARGLSGVGAAVELGRFLHKNKVGQKNVKGIRRKGSRGHMINKI
jgi:hypothetical protein